MDKTDTPMSPAELLEKLRARSGVPALGTVLYMLPPNEALSLLTTWRDDAVRAERERCIAIANARAANEMELAQLGAQYPTASAKKHRMRAQVCKELIGEFREADALQERPNE